MKPATESPDPTFLPASLMASDLGTWDYDAVRDRIRYCRNFARLYGLPPDCGGEGLPMARVTEATHPEDRARGLAKRAQLLRNGGAFVYEHRVLPSPGRTGWVLARGFYERGEAGRGIRGRGIVVDVTEIKQAGFAEGEVLFVTEADERTVGALDRAARLALALRAALGELGPEGDARLRPAAEAVLLEIARHIAGTLVPVVARRTEH